MKRLAIPAAILLLILIVWLVQRKIEANRIKGRLIENFLELKPDEINKIYLATPNDTLTFQKDKGVWYMQLQTPRRADADAVNNMISSAANMKVGNVISQNVERQKDFRVDSAYGNLVRFYRDDELLNEIIIGKMAPNRSQTYVRKPEYNDVYLAEGMLTFAFNRQLTQWLDRTIFSFNPDLIESIELAYADRAYKVTRHDSLWYVAKRPYKDSIIADSMKTISFVDQVSQLNANDFINATDNNKIDFDELSLTLNIHVFNDDSTYTLEFGKISEEGSRIYCRRPGFEEIYVIYKSRFQNLQREFSDFLL
jgi:hypothetical protein